MVSVSGAILLATQRLVEAGNSQVAKLTTLDSLKDLRLTSIGVNQGGNSHPLELGYDAMATSALVDELRKTPKDPRSAILEGREHPGNELSPALEVYLKRSGVIAQGEYGQCTFRYDDRPHTGITFRLADKAAEVSLIVYHP